MKIDEDILKDIILANWEDATINGVEDTEDDLKYNGGPLYDIQLSHISIYFRLSPNGCYYALVAMIVRQSFFMSG